MIFLSMSYIFIILRALILYLVGKENIIIQMTLKLVSKSGIFYLKEIGKINKNVHIFLLDRLVCFYL